MNSQGFSKEQLQLLPYGDDPLEVMAHTLLQAHRNALPRLEHVTVLLPDIGAAARLRDILLTQASTLGYPALLGPHIQSWQEWLNRQQLDNATLISDYRRELILLDALRQHAELFGTGNLWALTDSLLTLFDELTLNRVGLPRDIDDFTRRIASGYGLTELNVEAMDREAHLVHTLWHAWHDELHERGLIERNTRHLLQLSASAETHLNGQENIYLLSPLSASRAEREWLATMLQSGRLTLFLHGHSKPRANPLPTYHPEAPLQQLLTALSVDRIQCESEHSYSRFLDSVYSTVPECDAPLRERATAFAAEVPDDPLADRLFIHGANSDEEEARAVELQVRRWLLDGHRRIGIVTENRRLARRVRALLERSGIHLEDAAGWALSTTSAAAALERWLQCVEEDFPYRAMLDLLKSPFFIEDSLREEHLASVYRLEQDIVLHENIASGIERYQQHLAFRQQRLPDELAEQLQSVSLLLARLQQAAAPLSQRVTRGESDAGELLLLVQKSLEQLGLVHQLEADAAGMRLLEELQKMHQAVSHEKTAMDWVAFRSWVGRTLERYNFQPPATTQSVMLSGLSQTPLARFDALVIAAVEKEHLPGTPPATPFFNDSVRRELGLPTADTHLAERYYHFRRLLECAPHILLTHRRQHDGEEIAPSPWLELLQAFHQQAYGGTLVDKALNGLLANPQSLMVQRQLSLPPRSRMPQPALQPALIPSRYSASAYQQLMDCPYQFFAARGLGLAAPEAIREALEKSDYGERVHRCLQAFHGNVAELPGPYSGSWEAKRRDDAIQLLNEISEAVFAKDLEDNFLHRGWLQRWVAQIPAYIDWQMERAECWRVAEVEQQVEQQQAVAGVSLHGRLDRCDTNGEQLAIVDYKTGQSPDFEEVLSGEAIQLPFYALLAETSEQKVERVEYLPLDERKVAGKSVLEEQALWDLSHDVGQRLGILQKQMHEGVGLPAWGDELTCGYCQMSGVCRRQAWERQ